LSTTKPGIPESRSSSEVVKITELVSEQNIEELDGKKVAFMDLEGTLTYPKRKVPKNADPEHMRRLLDGEELEGEVEIGYWTGIHLLEGETPEEYHDRWDKWKNGDITVNEFENENTRMWNNLVEESDFNTAEEFLEWYNESFLNLRGNAKELIDILEEKGYTTALISHTSTSLCLHAAEKLGIDFVVPTWSFSFEDGKFTRADMEKYAEEKSHIIEELEELDTEEVIFFGNGQNDVNIAEKADKGYLVENKEDVNYSNINAFTASFEDIIEAQRREVKA
jgi:phosphoserine phosphatase